MENYDAMVTRQRKWMLYLLAILVLGVGFAPYPQIFQGLLLGAAASLYNLWLMQRKIKQVSEAVVDGKTKYGIGTLSRLTMAILVTVVALRFDEHFHIIAAVVGLVSSYIVLMADFFIQTFIRDKKA
ncbi:ATP synthase subunit I [Virgibacillus sp. NKC19-16]|uniref:ATP synthase subunit I n=1 Tax=Virgibacillus salidurans TaxID=2831673 RepID=UPI001F3B2C2F|nr:ATP synthase subunit I [Virgibacillus sp. NKC19-16]UJL45985.1 ATP synthase subunit I [Virgibacillus sp. NKC19-16]